MCICGSLWGLRAGKKGLCANMKGTPGTPAQGKKGPRKKSKKEGAPRGSARAERKVFAIRPRRNHYHDNPIN